MEQYISKSALVAEIKKAIESFFEYNDRIYDEYGNYFYKNADNDYRFYHKIDEDWNWDENRLSLDEMVYIYLNINTLEVKEVDLDALGVLANHLIACNAHGITPKYSDRELEFLEGLANNTFYKINTLEVKEVDFEKEVDDYGYHYDYVSLANKKELVDFAKHFFELGVSVSNKARKGE